MENVVNKVVLSGFAGNDAEVKTIAGDQKLVRVNLAVHEHYKTNAGENVSKTQWVNLVFWNSKADLAIEQIKKGTRLTVEGKLQIGSYEAKDGSKRYTAEVIVSDMDVKALAPVN